MCPSCPWSTPRCASSRPGSPCLSLASSTMWSGRSPTGEQSSTVNVNMFCPYLSLPSSTPWWGTALNIMNTKSTVNAIISCQSKVQKVKTLPQMLSYWEVKTAMPATQWSHLRWKETGTMFFIFWRRNWHFYIISSAVRSLVRMYGLVIYLQFVVVIVDILDLLQTWLFQINCRLAFHLHRRSFHCDPYSCQCYVFGLG